MSLKRTVLVATIAWIVAITAAHVALNLGGALSPGPASSSAAERARRFRVGFIPVTCHLTCPVTDFINRSMTGDNNFDPLRFNGFPELKEAFLAGHLPATFILAPLAMSLREQGVPIKIAYLGHRDGTAMMV